MDRNEEMLHRVAKEFASELDMRSKDPEYRGVLKKEECIRKLSIILDKDRTKTSELFDKTVKKYKNRFNSD